MNELFDKVSGDIKTAMLARDKVALEALRGMKKEFLEAKTAKGGDGNLADDVAVKLVQKMLKQRKESAQIYNEQNRPDLAQNELAEAAVIEKYLPAQMTDEEIELAVAEVIVQLGAAGPQDMGKVMGVASKQLAGKTEGRLISEKVKFLLSKIS
ncbi:MAG: glutamyl-tRNA amidotransferase [Porphyromonadaceae bacterium CG2_30_38_12]|nr:MAG: glutamyl-tRNA amidotransferase [Porphyromonadaceae bacterium CG2_30_38_12]